jgi:hypothetical protein
MSRTAAALTITRTRLAPARRRIVRNYPRGVTQAPGDRSSPRDRVTVVRTVSDLVLAVTGRHASTGVSIVIEGPPGIGKTFLVRQLLNAIPPGEATIAHIAGDHRRRNDPFAGLAELLGKVPDGEDPGEAAFARVDELCAAGPVVVYADDAHYLDAASLTLLRRLVWASRSLPLVVLITARPFPAREQLTMLISQAAVRLTANRADPRLAHPAEDRPAIQGRDRARRRGPDQLAGGCFCGRALLDSWL